MFSSLFAFAIIRGSISPVLFQSCQVAHRGDCVKIPDMIPAVGFKRFIFSVGPFEWQYCSRHNQELRIGFNDQQLIFRKFENQFDSQGV